MNADYERIKAERGPEVTRVLAAHEIGHAYTVIAQGNHVEFVTLVPDDVSAGRCVRRRAKSRSLNFVDDRQASTEQPSDPLMTKDIVTACANIGAPEFGIPRIDDAEAFIRSQTNIVELVAGDVCMRVMYPDLSLYSTDTIGFRLAHWPLCAARRRKRLRFAEAKAEALIREHMHVVNVLIDALAERGTLTGDELLQIINNAVSGELLDREHERRREMQARVESAEKFKERRYMSPCRLKAARLKGFITIAWLKCAAATPKAPTQRALLQALARFGRALAKKLMRSSVHEVPQCTGRTFYPLE